MSGKNGKPTPKGENGRDPVTGKFLPGCKGGPGNPLNARIHELKKAIIEAVTPEDISRGILSVIAIADDPKESGAIRIKAWELVFNRVIGKADQSIELQGGIDAAEVRTAIIAHLRGARA